ncbi:aminotransferase class I/II-fold pyridoxal phosphate-dependent enzyme [Lacrimispora saccharolytica]|uniref:Aminotransferase n=1 Tax=Lacrimispora saccharolytica (strain ATCC 35040 / DSM 2544 / NRCC 2533 / WM1) TaxID=610130 RepID=D9R551_LACSW|nr:aminotransferase class I/II-fold pyridoxal phosphate-dependent enzyme [Lacrimispora saccharolytica]ADL05158.1 aminotransferase class I and II [[Clostridium] saccharolyticum WM1]QRV20658.1 aminotransferase class I/II-fold pyridoxal phosphate-dependent enzyme [Lacrimispora saccharolytica]
MQAIILAAGMGRRLKKLTENQPKCMISVNGIPMIQRMLKQLDHCHLNRIIIVTGHKGEELQSFVSSLPLSTPVTYIDNPVYKTTNNIYSLFLAKDQLLMDDTILLESDLIFEQEVLTQIISDPYPNLALVAPFESWMDGTVVLLDKQDNIMKFLTRKDFRFEDIHSYYKTVNIYKFSRSFSSTHYVPFLEAYSKALGNNEYYEQVLKVISLLDDHDLKATRLENGFWYEIDDEQDLDIAESIFTDSQSRLSRLSKRFGGYWRYPGLLDFCYLVNPYFPNSRFMGEIKASFEALTTSYPSGLDVNNLLAAKSLGLEKNQILTGNGAAELIKPLIRSFNNAVGVLKPSFEEYGSCSQHAVYFSVTTPDYTYTAQDIMDFYKDKELEALVLVNPDNPTGNYIPKKDVLSLAQYCKERNITLILDESFIDFSFAEESPSLMSQEILDEYRNLVLIKSISKSYGVPGLRLGLLACSDPEVIRRVRKELPIWNINSLAEYFLQIFEKYRRDYQEALEHFKSTREKLFRSLQSIRQLKLYPSQANFIMCEITDGCSATQIAELLLNRYNILVKDLSHKPGMEGREFIRIAVRTEEDNERLADALKHILR